MKNDFKRLGILVCGTIIMGLGVAIAVKGGQGADPLAMFWEGLANIFPISIGIANLLVSLVMIGIVCLIDCQEIHIGTLINPIVLSISTDIFMKIIDTPSFFEYQLVQSIIGIIVIGLGIGVYSSSHIGKGSYEALTFTLEKKLKMKLSTIRMIGDAILLISSYFLGAHIGIATVLAVVLIGKIMSNVCYFCQRKWNLMI